MDDIKTGDIVIFKDQSKNHIENTLYGGKVALMQGTQTLLLHTDGIYRMWPTEDLRKVTKDDLNKPGMAII